MKSEKSNMESLQIENWFFLYKIWFVNYLQEVKLGSNFRTECDDQRRRLAREMSYRYEDQSLRHLCKNKYIYDLVCHILYTLDTKHSHLEL